MPSSEEQNAQTLVDFLLGKEGTRRNFLKAGAQTVASSLIPGTTTAPTAAGAIPEVVKQALSAVVPLPKSLVRDMVVAAQGVGIGYEPPSPRSVQLREPTKLLAQAALGEIDAQVFYDSLPDLGESLAGNVRYALPHSQRAYDIIEAVEEEDFSPEPASDAVQKTKALYDTLTQLQCARSKAYVALVEQRIASGEINPNHLKEEAAIFKDDCFRGREITDLAGALYSRYVVDRVLTRHARSLSKKSDEQGVMDAKEAIDKNYYALLDEVAMQASGGTLSEREQKSFAAALRETMDDDGPTQILNLPHEFKKSQLYDAIKTNHPEVEESFLYFGKHDTALYIEEVIPGASSVVQAMAQAEQVMDIIENGDIEDMLREAALEYLGERATSDVKKAIDNILYYSEERFADGIVSKLVGRYEQLTAEFSRLEEQYLGKETNKVASIYPTHTDQSSPTLAEQVGRKNDWSSRAVSPKNPLSRN